MRSETEMLNLIKSTALEENAVDMDLQMLVRNLEN